MDCICMHRRTLEEGADWVKSHVDEKRVVYVHCKSGIGRSASVVAAYYMKHKQMGAQVSIHMISQQTRSITNVFIWQC